MDIELSETNMANTKTASTTITPGRFELQKSFATI